MAADTASIGRIVVAVDFGDASARAVAVSGALARRAGAGLWLLHAESLDVPPYFTHAQIQAIEGEAHANERRAAEYLRAFGSRHTTHPFQTIVESRAADEAILHATREADLVVMGTHGRRGPSRWWLGSVAERVLRETAVPLLVVRGSAEADAPEQALATGVVLTGGPGGADRARALAAAVAASVGGSIVESTSENAAAARVEASAGWVAVPMPTPRTPAWLSKVGERWLRDCTAPLLFVPEAEGGPTR